MSDYTHDVSIDIHQLDIEWERQASIYLKCSQEYANAIYLRDKLKFQVDVVCADLDKEIRSNPFDFGLDKVTEAAVKSCIIQHSKYKAINKKLNDANLDVNMLAAAKSSLEHKKKALEKLTDLYLSGYWADPKIPSEARETYSKEQTHLASKGLRESSRMQVRVNRKLKSKEKNNGKR